MRSQARCNQASGGFCEPYVIASARTADAASIARSLVLATGIYSMYKEDKSMEGQGKLENVDELLNGVDVFVEEEANTRSELYQIEHDGLLPPETPLVTLSDFLENVSLLSNVDSESDGETPKDSVALMTVHSAKGLEFPYVYIVGLEENLFPSSAGGMLSEREIEEERRLCYVAITRAEKSVTLSYASSRSKYGQHVSNPPSRFIREIDPEFISDSAIAARKAPVARNFTPVRKTDSGMAIAGADFVPDPVSSLSEGARVEHSRFGYGVVLRLEGAGNDAKAVVRFDQFGEKTLLLKFAKLRVV